MWRHRDSNPGRCPSWTALGRQGTTAGTTPIKSRPLSQLSYAPMICRNVRQGSLRWLCEGDDFPKIGGPAMWGCALGPGSLQELLGRGRALRLISLARLHGRWAGKHYSTGRSDSCPVCLRTLQFARTWTRTAGKKIPASCVAGRNTVERSRERPRRTSTARRTSRHGSGAALRAISCPSLLRGRYLGRRARGRGGSV